MKSKLVHKSVHSEDLDAYTHVTADCKDHAKGQTPNSLWNTHEPHINVREEVLYIPSIRKDVFFQESKARAYHICGQTGHMAEACKGKVKPKAVDFDEKDKSLADRPLVWLRLNAYGYHINVRSDRHSIHGL